jgi:class 3 adenylate cyclase
MRKGSIAIDPCLTTAEVIQLLHSLIGEFLSAIKKHDRIHVTFLSQSNIMDGFTCPVRLLLNLPASDLGRHADALSLLTSICRLLIQLGDRQSLDCAITLSYRLHHIERQHNWLYPTSDLYRGISQIGIGDTITGTRSVWKALQKMLGDEVFLLERCLGYWALVSAAIRQKDLRLAARFTTVWLLTAEENGLGPEAFRARLVLLLIRLLIGNEDQCPKELESLSSEVPVEWQDVVGFLQEWAKMLRREGDILPLSFSIQEPLPLLLGLDWLGTGAANRGASSEGFSNLCALRRRFCNLLAVSNDVSAEALLDYAARLVEWELLKPLRQVEVVLKEKSPVDFYKFMMNRILGKWAFEQISYETSVNADVAKVENAIVLRMDVRGSSALGERVDPESIFGIISPICKIMNEAVEGAGGMVLEFTGDGFNAVFNTFPGQNSRIITILWHTIRALNRITMRNLLNSPGLAACDYQVSGPLEINVGIGINQGPLAVGYFGGLSRCCLTIQGETINAAAHIESLTKQLPGTVLISKSCFDNQEPDVWTEPMEVNFSVRDMRQHRIKNISKPVHLFSVSPLLSHWIDFVPMGFVAHPEEGVVYIDTGNSGEPGIIDHHYVGNEAKSACALLVQKPELLLGHIQGITPSQIEFRLHTIPDLDCAATLYAARELMEGSPREGLLKKLADYVCLIDQGMLPFPESLADSLYGVFLAHRHLVEKRHGRQVTDRMLLEAGIRVVDAAFYLMEKNEYGAEFAQIFQFEPRWFAQERSFLKGDRTRYQEDLKARSRTYQASTGGCAEPVTGLWADHPQSILFKFWARNDPGAPGGKGYPFLAVDWSKPSSEGKTTNRFVISVDPGSQRHLQGLGEILEACESKKREELGQQRPIHPIRYPSDNSDPWYFGQGHEFTIIDSPHEGTVLTPEEVQRIHAEWCPPGWTKEN